MWRTLSALVILSLLAAGGGGDAEARLDISDPLDPTVRFPQRDDLTVLDGSATDSTNWQLVVRNPAGTLIVLSEAQGAQDSWTARIEDRTRGWWATYTTDLGLSAGVEEELPEGWLGGDWLATLKELERKGQLHVIHRFETSDGISWTVEDDGESDPVTQLAGRYRQYVKEERTLPEVVPFLLALGANGYFRKTSQTIFLLQILSGNALSSDAMMNPPQAGQGAPRLRDGGRRTGLVRRLGGL